MKGRHYSMKWKVIRILLVCWLIPLAFFGVLGVYIGSNHRDMTAENYLSQLKFNNKICVERLDRAVADSRQASYDEELLNLHERCQKGELDADSAYKGCTDYLNAKYQKSSAVSSAVLWFEDDRERFCSTYSEAGGGTYQQLRNYWERDHGAVEEYAAQLGTSVGFLVRKNALYLVRNLVDSRYQTQGTLVFCLNQNYCFDSVAQFPMQDDVCVWINKEEPLLCGEEEAREWEEQYESLNEQGENCRWIRGQLCVTDTAKGDSYNIRVAMMIRSDVSMFPFYGYPYVLAVLLLSLILTMIAVLNTFRREVTSPVEVLSEGMRHIEQGELGYQISEEMHNLEFDYLTSAVNRMSENLEQQILKSYQEEIALREARIMALQSHINPHFLNNTLEIINWEARLGGNEKVGKMIEALSNVMDAALDRGKRPEVPLREEIGYANSYLYIMKERLGERLSVDIEIPDELMDCPVPRLILQPLIENAIEHGIIPKRSGIVFVRGYRDEEYLYLETENDGGLTREDRERIARLLDINYNTSKEPAGNMGIANVNQRLHILFGEPCGLVIEERDGKVTARLTIPWKG